MCPYYLVLVFQIHWDVLYDLIHISHFTLHDGFASFWLIVPLYWPLYDHSSLDFHGLDRVIQDINTSSSIWLPIKSTCTHICIGICCHLGRFLSLYLLLCKDLRLLSPAGHQSWKLRWQLCMLWEHFNQLHSELLVSSGLHGLQHQQTFQIAILL